MQSGAGEPNLICRYRSEVTSDPGHMERGGSVAVSTPLWLAREGDPEGFSTPKLEEPEPPEAVDFAAVHEQITQRGPPASQGLRSALRAASRQTRPEPVPRGVPTVGALSRLGHGAGRLRRVRIEALRSQFRRPSAVRAAAGMSSDSAIGSQLRFASLACDPILQPHCPAPLRAIKGQMFPNGLGLPSSGSHSCHRCHAILGARLFDTCHR